MNLGLEPPVYGSRYRRVSVAAISGLFLKPFSLWEKMPNGVRQMRADGER